MLFRLVAAVLLSIPILCWSGVNPNETQGYLVCNDMSQGRLGNQLFIISTALAYAWDHDFKPRFPALNESKNQLSYNRDKFFFRLNAEPVPYKIHYNYAPKRNVYAKIPTYSNYFNVSLKGLFFSWKYFHHHEKELIAIYEPSPEIMDYLEGKYKDLIERDDTVAVHVRTYSQWLHKGGLCFLGMNFFKHAFENYPKEATFVIFSDRINWCIHNFPREFPDRYFVFIQGNDHIEDLYLMSMMKHQILSNSTYSWWAAYLNKNPMKLVTAPEHYLKRTQFWPPEDFYLPEWKIVSYDFRRDPYPKDMQDYDEPTFDDIKTNF